MLSKSFFHHLLLLLLLSTLLTILQTYWAMGQYRHKLSSSCFHCSFELELFFYLLSLLTFLIPIHILRKYMNFNSWIHHFILVLVHILFWIWMDYELFIGREAAWSTYTNHEVWFYVLHHSFVPIGFCLLIYTLGLWKIPSNFRK